MISKTTLINEMYGSIPNIVFGFHGCDISTYKNVIYNNEGLHESSNEQDWLGDGIYFWEQNYERAVQWAEDRCKTKPAVIGAILDLGYCLNLLDSKYISLLKDEYTNLKYEFDLNHKQLPVNKGGMDRTGRYLDRAVIQHLHTSRSEDKKRPFDSVRGVFWEGREIYSTAGFKEKSHIQICIRNPNCIKGYFTPRMLDQNWHKL